MITPQQHADMVLQAYQAFVRAGIAAEDAIEALVAQSMLPPLSSETELDITLNHVAIEMAQ